MSPSEDEGNSGGGFMGGLKEKLHGTKLHDAKVALHHKRFVLSCSVPGIRVLIYRI